MEPKQNADHARFAAKKSREAHEAWLEALRTTGDDARHAEAMRRGDEAWLEAERSLREFGVSETVSETTLTRRERETLLTDPCFTLTGHVASESEPIDFKPLQRAVFVAEAIKFFNRSVLAVLLFGAGAVYCWHQAHGEQAASKIQITGGK